MPLLATAILAILLLFQTWRARHGETRFPPQGSRVLAGGLDIHFLREGSGQPLVFLHGSEGSLIDLPTELIASLVERYDLVRYDRPGHGHTSLPASLHSGPIENARILHEVVQALHLEPSLILAHSWGALPALIASIEYPDSIAGIVLLAPWSASSRGLLPALLWPVRLPLIGPWLASALLAPMRGPLIRHSLRSAFSPLALPHSFAERASALWLRGPGQVRAFAEENTLDRHFLKQYADRLGEISVPVVMVAGDADRAVDPEQNAGWLAARRPDWPLHRCPGAGHQIAFQAPEAVMAALEECVALGRRERPTARDRARDLVLRHGWNAAAYQILNGGMRTWFAPGDTAVVGYVVRAGVRIVAGAPVCAEEELLSTSIAFEADASAAGERVCYFAAAQRLRAVLEGRPPHTALVVGSQPAWDPQTWGETLRRSSSLRGQVNRARNKGTMVTEWERERAASEPGLQDVLKEWLALHPLPALGFLTEPVRPERLGDRRIFVAEQAGRQIGFLAMAPIPEREGWLIEQICRRSDAPNGTAELLVDAGMRAAAEAGSSYVTLGLAPLSNRAPSGAGMPGPLVRLALAWARAHGKRFYNFQGLDAFKAKLKPDTWEPIYAVSNEARFSLHTLYAAAAAFSDRPPAAVLFEAVAGAVRQELSWLRQARRSSEPNPPGAPPA